jgi:hypothetical protein
METRDVTEGMVACPLGEPVPIVDCRECHLLQSLEDDWRWSACVTPED